jgi:hypothetical protein
MQSHFIQYVPYLNYSGGKMNWAIRIIFIVSLIAGSIVSFSQQGNVLMDSLARRMDIYAGEQGKTAVYLKCDKDIYIAGEDLWFNAFVLNAQFFSLSDLDKILYLQLTQKDGDSVVWKEMYPITKGIAGGHVHLPHTLTEGNYLLKAYTAHSFFFHQPYFSTVAPIQIVKNPRSIKSYWQLGQSLAPQKGGNIRFDIFPEGGTLVSGLPNVVAFKAVNRDGLPVNISGTLLKNGTPLLNIKTFHSGMGSFVFTPEANTAYAVRIDSDPESLFKIRPISEEGVVMHLDKNEKDSLIFKIVARHQKPKNVFLRIQVRGMLQSIAAGTLKDSLIIKLPVADMPAGIAEATLFDEQLHPLAGRLVFLHQESKLNIHFNQVKDHYAPKEQVTLKIKTTDVDGKPIPAVLSLRVYDQFFANRKNVRNIVNYYQLSTQLSDHVYDPSYYFDTNNSDRKDALDLLLLTQGRQQYNWNEKRIIQDAAVQRPVLSDSLQSFLLSANKSRKDKQPISLMLFNYNKTVTQVAVADNSGMFYVTPKNLFIGHRFFIKYFSGNEYNIRVTDPFDTIKAIEEKQHPVYLLGEKSIVTEGTTIDSSRLQYGQLLQEVVVQAKGRAFGDRYLGYLDSIARFEGNTDYVGQCGWLNCPACGGGTKPVEGITYSELIEPKRSQVNSHPFPFTDVDKRKVTYHYPNYTEEELLKKFKMVITKGFNQHRKFFEPNYDEEDKTVADTRNTLYWNPMVITDENGEATIRFFCSDIHSRFIGVAEGVGGNAILGSGTFNFTVR